MGTNYKFEPVRCQKQEETVARNRALLFFVPPQILPTWASTVYDPKKNAPIGGQSTQALAEPAKLGARQWDVHKEKQMIEKCVSERTKTRTRTNRLKN